MSWFWHLICIVFLYRCWQENTKHRLNFSTPSMQPCSPPLRATTVQAQRQLHNRRKKFCKFHTLLPAKKRLGPDSAIFGRSSLFPIFPLPPATSGGPCSRSQPCLDTAPGKHLEVTGYGVTSNKSEQAQICGTVQSALCSERGPEESNYETWLKRHSSK